MQQYKAKMFAIIAAIGLNKEMGAHGELPWGRSQQADLQWLHEKMAGKTVIAGRTTYQQMADLLSAQPVYVLTRQPPASHPANVHYVSEPQTLGDLQRADEEVLVLGGATVNALLLPYTKRLYLTEITASFPEADTFFPEFNAADYRVVETQKIAADIHNKYAMNITTYELRGEPKALQAVA